MRESLIFTSLQLLFWMGYWDWEKWYGGGGRSWLKYLVIAIVAIIAIACLGIIVSSSPHTTTARHVISRSVSKVSTPPRVIVQVYHCGKLICLKCLNSTRLGICIGAKCRYVRCVRGRIYRFGIGRHMLCIFGVRLVSCYR